MGILFKKPKLPASNKPAAQVSGLRLNQTPQGKVIPVAFGVNRLAMNIIGAWDWLKTTTTKPGTQPGKGLGGTTAPGTTTDSYTENIQTALCHGVVGHIGSIWTAEGGSIGVTQISTSFTVPGGGGHIDITDANFRGDTGVGADTSYSQAVDDFGANDPHTLTGSYSVALERGLSVAPGVYTVTNPSAGVTRYTFHSADAGKSLQINYQSSLAVVNEKAELVIPHSLVFAVPSPSTYIGFSFIVREDGTQLYGPGPGGLSFAPPVGFYAADNSGNFKFNAADEGLTIIINWVSRDPDTSNGVLNDTLITGELGQSPWDFLVSHHNDPALGYSGVALWCFPALGLPNNAVPQMTAETFGTDFAAGSGIYGCNPADVIKAILTDSRFGAGLDAGLLGDWSNARDYWQASGFFISGVWDSQTTALDAVSQILEAGQGVMFWADGQLQIAVYSDTSIAGNGAVFQPDTQPVVEFNIDDFVAARGASPVRVETEAVNHVFNKVNVEFNNYLLNYDTEIISEEDPASIAANDLYEESTQSWHFIRSAVVAQWAGNLRLKKYTNIRDTFEYTVPTRYRPLLRVMKLITITWDHMGWAQKPLRITRIVESHKGLVLSLEEFPYGTAKATLYPKMTPQAVNANQSLINPGDTSVVVLEEPDLLNGFAGRTIRVYANPETPENWGGAQIFTSDDNSAFVPLGQLNAPVVLGSLASTLNVGSGDPDTQSIIVTVTDGLVILQPPASDFTNKISLLAIVSGSTVEIVAFKNAVLSGANTYTIDTFHRGLFGTTRASHSPGATVVEMGETFLKYTYPADRDGSNLYIKAASFNKLGLRQQDIASLSSETIVLTGNFPGFYDKASGTLSLAKTTDDTPSGRFAVSTVDGATRKALIDFTHIHANKTIDNVSDGSTYARTTPNQVTGAGRAFTNINSDNTYATLAYHGSAFRAKATSNVGGGTSSTSYVTVGSFVLQIPAGFSQYKGVITLVHSGLTPYTMRGRLKIGSLVSNEIVGVSTGASGTVTVTGITGGTQITVEVQAKLDAGSSGTISSCLFAQVQYTDQDTDNLQ